jgi:hypothetical protein
MNLRRRYTDQRHWLDKGRYAYPLFITVGLILWCFLTGCGGGESVTAPATTTLSMDAPAWSFRYSPGMSKHPTPAIGSGWQFDFPQQDGVHYLTTPFTAAVLGKTITVTSQVIGDPVYAWHDDECKGSPATAHIMVEQQGDDLIKGSGRWWYGVPVPLTVGPPTTVVAPIVQGRWTNVYGEFDPVGFDEAMTHPGFVGLTFGGGCFYGHGVWLQAGASRMIVRDFTIQ